MKGLALLLSCCGSDSAPEPLEQIIVREPGAPPVKTAADTAGESTDESGEELTAKGKNAFAVCVTCHSREKGAPPGAGPNLFGIAGRKAGTDADFADYSEALAASGISWNDANLDAYIADPQGKIPGTSMVAGAVSDAEQRAAIIAYLKSLKD